MYPIIVLSLFFVIALLYQIGETMRQMCAEGAYVWHRDNLGSSFNNLLLHISIFITSLQMRQYILVKESIQWKPDLEGDKQMDFIDAWWPMMTLTGLYLFKQLCCKAENQVLCTIMAATVIALVLLGKRLFDESN